MSNGKKKQRGWLKKKDNDCFWMENIFCLESHIHLCLRHTSAIPAYVIKTCLTWHAFLGARYWGFVSPKLHVSTYRNQQHCWWFQEKYTKIALQSESWGSIVLTVGTQRVSHWILPAWPASPWSWWPSQQVEASPIFSGHARVKQWSNFSGRGPIFSGHRSWNIWWWFCKLRWAHDTCFSLFLMSYSL